MRNTEKINEEITYPEVRVINAEDNKVMPTAKALKLAYSEDKDLILITPNANPPVCKIMAYDKFKYEMSKKEKENKKKQKETEIKEIRLSLNIDDNDIKTKINAARKFLTKKNKVKLTLRFRGREIANADAGKTIMNGFIESLSDISHIETMPKIEGKTLTSVIVCGKKK